MCLEKKSDTIVVSCLMFDDSCCHFFIVAFAYCAYSLIYTLSSKLRPYPKSRKTEQLINLPVLAFTLALT